MEDCLELSPDEDIFMRELSDMEQCISDWVELG